MNSEKTLYKTTRVVWYFFSVIEALLLFRFLLKLLAANPGAGFTNLIYSLSSGFVAPFRFVFEANTLGGVVFEWSTLLAMAVYWFAAWGIVKLIVMGRDVSHVEAERGLESQDKA